MKDNIEKIEYKKDEDFQVIDMGAIKKIEANNYVSFLASFHWAGKNNFEIDYNTLTIIYNKHSVDIFKKDRRLKQNKPNPPKPSAKKEDKTDDKVGNTSPKKGPTKSSSKVSNKKS